MCGLCRLFVILPIVTHVSSTTFKVFGQIGDNVTLPCRYDTRSRSGPSFCWGRGKVPMSKCTDTILSSEDGWVSSRRSTRYQLQGRLLDGDVSLTIMQAQRGDAGTYGCRVEVPGWFNDYKVNIRLSLEEVPVEEPSAKDWTPTTTVGEDNTETTSDPLTLQIEDFLLGSATSEEEEPLVAKTKTTGAFLFEATFQELFGTGNVCRTAAFLLLSVVVILVFAYRRRLTQRAAVKADHAPVMENLYESVPMSGQWAATPEQRHPQNS